MWLPLCPTWSVVWSYAINYNFIINKVKDLVCATLNDSCKQDSTRVIHMGKVVHMYCNVWQCTPPCDNNFHRSCFVCVYMCMCVSGCVCVHTHTCVCTCMYLHLHVMCVCGHMCVYFILSILHVTARQYMYTQFRMHVLYYLEGCVL